MNKYIQTYMTAAEYEAGTKENPNVSFVEETYKLYYNGEEHQLPIPPSKMYLTFKAIDSGTFSFSNSINYSLDDGQNWVSLASNTATPTVSAGSKIMWKASGLTPDLNNGIGTFSSTGQFEVMGNAMSLVSGDSFSEATTVANYQFIHLFNGCTGLSSAENLSLPATTLAQYCYSEMFFNCTSITKAPELPALALANGCYDNMFRACSSLTKAPELPATTLTNQCYLMMFYGCTNLNMITCLATDISQDQSTFMWLDSVASTGTFVKNASMTSWPTGADGIPTGWTVVDA